MPRINVVLDSTHIETRDGFNKRIRKCKTLLQKKRQVILELNIIGGELKGLRRAIDHFEKTIQKLELRDSHLEGLIAELSSELEHIEIKIKRGNKNGKKINNI